MEATSRGELKRVNEAEPPRDQDGPLPWAETSRRKLAPPPAQTDHQPPPSSDDAGEAAPDPELTALGGLPPAAKNQALVRRASALRDAIPALLDRPEAHKRDVLKYLDAVRDELVRDHLSTLPVERVRDATEGRLRLGSLANSGFNTVASVYQVTPRQLMHIPGVGEQTATQVVAAARHIAEATRKTLPVRFDPDRRSAAHTTLLGALRAYDDAARLCEPLSGDLSRLHGDLGPVVAASASVGGKVKWFFTRGARRAGALETIGRLESLLLDPRVQALDRRLRQAYGELARPPVPEAALWSDFQARAPEYYGLLGELAGPSLDVAAVHGHLPTELAEAIARLHLDTSWLTVSVRGYQAFGAKFALVQKRSILGDEMGLGKTIEAIAVMGHLASLGSTHFLVVCPASVIVNWTREVSTRSKLQAHRIHGTDRDGAQAAWRRRGGVGVTTYDTLRHVLPPAEGVTVAALVVDEAHFVKNPATQRARILRRWTDTTERVVFLTGTPMENCVDEFRTLVDYLQPEVAASLDKVSGLAGAAHFRASVAPAYLRRNQEDVLSELPDRLDAEDWIELSEQDSDAYREAVRSGNFMAMRRAPLMSGLAGSAKLQRLAEILDESEANGWKVVVFSNFRDVLDITLQMIGDTAFGPLTGSTPPAGRQQLIDEFSASPGYAVLLSQIQAGGTGLNMQAASVVVLTEPQWKPSTEEQAIARCHRMGQVRRVHVHRLLAQDSADRRMLEVLDAKRGLFNEYVRFSAMKDSTPDAVDISDADAAKTASFAALEQEIIDQERARLGLS